MTRKQINGYPNIPDFMKERFLRISAQLQAEKALRNHAIAEWLGWYEEPGAIGIWYRKDENGIRDLIYNEYTQTVRGGLPFDCDMDYLIHAMDELFSKLRPYTTPHELRTTGDYFYDTWFITEKGFYCNLLQWTNDGWDTDKIVEIEIKMGEDVIGYGAGLFMFVSQIILTITNRLNELE